MKLKKKTGKFYKKNKKKRREQIKLLHFVFVLQIQIKLYLYLLLHFQCPSYRAPLCPVTVTKILYLLDNITRNL